MKQIFFVRHAKSSWADLTQEDILRPLNARGARDGPVMAAHLRKQLSHMDIMLISPAKRAQLTAAFFKEQLDLEVIATIDKIYHADVETLIEVVMDIEDRYDTAIIFGHNPGFSFLHNHFASEPIGNLPTCGIFCLNIKSDSWSKIDTTNTFVSHLVYPKLLL